MHRTKREDVGVDIATAGSALIQACEKAGSVVPRYVTIYFYT